jgi:predicted nucleic acid-binding protein
MKYLLDTDAFSDIVRGNINVEARFWENGRVIAKRP